MVARWRRARLQQVRQRVRIVGSPRTGSVEPRWSRGLGRTYPAQPPEGGAFSLSWRSGRVLCWRWQQTRLEATAGRFGLDRTIDPVVALGQMRVPDPRMRRPDSARVRPRAGEQPGQPQGHLVLRQLPAAVRRPLPRARHRAVPRPGALFLLVGLVVVDIPIGLCTGRAGRLLARRRAVARCWAGPLARSTLAWPPGQCGASSPTRGRRTASRR